MNAPTNMPFNNFTFYETVTLTENIRFFQFIKTKTEAVKHKVIGSFDIYNNILSRINNNNNKYFKYYTTDLILTLLDI